VQALKKNRLKIIIIGYMMLLLTACNQAGSSMTPDNTSTSPALPPQEDNMPDDLPLPTAPIPGDDMPKDPPLTIPRSPGPSVLIESAKADLAQRLSVSATQIKAIETKEAVWPDASLGCPQPGITYAQIPTQGYIIMLEYAGDKFEYHASIRGAPLYCENPTPPIS
jgi:hypothetical protein